MTLRLGSSATLRLGAAVIVLLAACASDDSSGGENAGDSGSGGSGAAGGGDAGGECKRGEHPLFAPRAFGKNGNDVIGRLAFDADSGDLYMSAGDALHVLRKAQREPELFAMRPADIGNDFWLEDDRILLPTGLLVPLVDEAKAILFTLPRSGGDPEVLIAAPANTDVEYRYEVLEVVVSGDDVFWIASDGHTDNIARIPPIYDRTYYVRKTSWRAPGTPVDVYSGPRRISGLIIAGGYAFVDRELAMNDPETDQIIVDLATSKALPMTTERYGGEVVYGSDDALIVSRLDSDNLADFGTFYIAPDGSGATKLDGVLILRIGSPLAAHAGDEFAFVSSKTNAMNPLGSDMHVFTFSKADGLRDVGCFDGSGTEHAVEIAEDRVLVAVFREGKATVLEFER